jgi:hypothetical protein
MRAVIVFAQVCAEKLPQTYAKAAPGHASRIDIWNLRGAIAPRGG